MSKFSVEFKTVERDNFTTVTKQAKQVFEDQINPADFTGILTSPGLEYFVVRKLVERKAAPAKPEKKS